MASDAQLSVPKSAPHWFDRHCKGIDRKDQRARDIYFDGLPKMPRWASFALSVRNFVVGLLGLKTEGAEGGELMANLPVVQDSEDCFECGLEDKHLTFTLKTELESNKVCITTNIWFNHWTGRLYLAIVYLPHKLIMRQMLARLK